MRRIADRDGRWEWAWRRPERTLSPAVLLYRGFRLTGGPPRRRLEVPVGAVTLMLGFAHQTRITEIPVRPDDPPGAAAGTLYTSLLSPLRTRSGLGEHAGSLHGVEVLLAPWATYTLLGIALHELSGRILDPAEVLGRRADLLAEQLAAQPGWQQRFRLLDATLPAWLARGPECSERVVWAYDELSRTGGQVPIRQLAERTGWGWRQFEHRFAQQIGLPPKGVARVMRLRRTLRLLADGATGVAAAAACGFADQSHMSREVRAMTGYPPFRLLRGRCAEATVPPVLDRIDGQVTSFRPPS